MSIDIKLQNACDHRINWIRSELETDRKTIFLSYPIASTASFKLRINNVVLPKSSYGFSNSEESTVVEPTRYVSLKKKSKLNDPIIEAQYTTFLDYCPKCVGLRYIDDLTYDKSGDLNTVRNEYLLVQNVEKRVITELGSNVFHENMGTNLHSLVNQKILDFDLIRNQITDQIITSLNRLKESQRTLLASRREVSDGELLDKIGEVIVERAEDPTILRVTVTFTARSGRTLEYTQFLELSRQRVAFV
ncbi:MAG: hypothetical protein GF334_00945 [Candidatus Altiarchaeales archaeon]|nr:hypothetical protein [Candidatus Altiarchaeales archaeon]